MVTILPLYRGVPLKTLPRRAIASSKFRQTAHVVLGLASFILMACRLGAIREESDISWFRNYEPFISWDDFSKLSMRQMRDQLHCRSLSPNRDETKLITTLEDWQFMRDKMREHLESAAPLDDPVPPTLGYTFGSGGPPPFEVGYSEGKGRGLFATRDIKEGELVHDGTNSDVTFKSGISFKKYIWSMHMAAKDSIACETLYWCDTMKYNGQFKIGLPPNISVFMNNGEPANTLPKTSTSLAMYATQDINEGEEILTDYSIYPTKWGKAGL